MMFASFPKAQYQAYRSEIDAAIARVLDSGSYIMGAEVKAFEKEFATHIGLKHAIGVGSGTDALTLALMALDIGAGDDVISVSHTAVATTAAIRLTGANPILVDIEADYFTLDPACLKAAITKKTKAVVVVHLYGQAADMDAICAIAANHGLKIVEDCAQAVDATGSLVGGIAGAVGRCVAHRTIVRKRRHCNRWRRMAGQFEAHAPVGGALAATIAAEAAPTGAHDPPCNP